MPIDPMQPLIDVDRSISDAANVLADAAGGAPHVIESARGDALAVLTRARARLADYTPPGHAHPDEPQPRPGDEQARPPGEGTLTIKGDPAYGTGFELRLGAVDLLDVDPETYIEAVELRLRGGEPARAYITIDLPRVDVSVPASVELAPKTHNLMRALGWTPPPPDIPPHQVVREQSGTCVLYVGPYTVCGARPDDPIHTAGTE